MSASNQTLGDMPGEFDLQVQQTSHRDEYSIRAVGYPSGGGSPRVISATARVTRAKISGAGHFGGNVTIPTRTTVSGVVQSTGTVVDNSTSPLITKEPGPLPATSYQIPTAATINFYGADTTDGKYICPDGTIGYAQRITSAPTGPLVADSNNPGKIFYYQNDTVPDLSLTSSFTLNGTLVVKGGGISVRALGIEINPLSGYPALVLERDLNMFRTNVSLTAQGAVWVGRSITWTPLMTSNTGSTLTIKGSLLMPMSTGATIATPGTGGAMVFEYANVDVPDLSKSLQPGTSVQILSWND
jgi:hypothetical protein